METITVAGGFSEQERVRVAGLYWEAFGRKLRPAFADEPTAFGTVRVGLEPRHTLVARCGGRLVGVCGFHQDGIGILDLPWRRLRGRLTRRAALRATLVLAVLSHRPRAGTLTLDGICVEESARGRGIGTALLEAAAEHARRGGARALRLSVVDANPRARALYERLGFVAVANGSLGPLANTFGFDRHTTMELEVTS